MYKRFKVYNKYQHNLTGSYNVQQKYKQQDYSCMVFLLLLINIPNSPAIIANVMCQVNIFKLVYSEFIIVGGKRDSSPPEIK